MIKLRDAVPEYCHLPILNTLHCIMKILLKGTGVILFLLYTLSNERAYNVMLPQEGALS